MEHAFQNLHAAEIFLVELFTKEELDARVPNVVARAHTILERDDPRREFIDALQTMDFGPAKRATMQQAMDIAFDASDQLHVRVRNFRNILLSSAAIIAVLMLGLIIVVSDNPNAMPMCFNPSITGPTVAASPVPTPGATGPASPVPTVSPTPGATPTPVPTPAPARQETAGMTGACPSGDSAEPSRGDVVIVAGLGLLGGALAAAFSIRKLRGTSTPYDVPIALALLKVPTGSLTAVAGIVLLGGGFVPGLSELDSQRQILAYALVLGYAQQIATRFIDDRAQSLLSSIPSKDPEAKQPMESRPAPAPPTGQRPEGQ